MPDQNPMRTARRKARRFAYLGTNEPCCSDCGEADIACLELDHPLGRSRDAKFVEIVCRNCHRKREMKRDVTGLTMNGLHRTETPKESLRRFLLLLADNHDATAASIRRKAEELCSDDDRTT